jgi:putative membrane protein
VIRITAGGDPVIQARSTRGPDNRSVIREWLDPDRLRQVGHTPDYRFSLANERTFLAWIRTGLALVAGGLVVAQFLPELWLTHLREVLAIALMLLGGAVALRAFNHWLRTERAIRLDEDLPQSRFPVLLAVAVALGASLLVAVVIIEAWLG